MTTKRKRAPGGGRKPKGEFSNLTSPLSIRMPADIRDQLRKAAAQNGRSASQELLGRLKKSLDYETHKERDRAMRALCFLISELAVVVTGWSDSKNRPAANWRTDPFFFHAFSLAVAHVLNAIAPKGKIKNPQWIRERGDAVLSYGLPETLSSPEVRGKFAADVVLQWLHVARFEDVERRKLPSHFVDMVYRMVHARRDLDV